MVQVEVSNTYIDMNVNNVSEEWTGKITATKMWIKRRPISGFKPNVCNLSSPQALSKSLEPVIFIKSIINSI